MEIERTRYIILRNNRTEIFCGASKNHSFEKIEDIQNKKISIQTYATEKLARSSFEHSWWNINFDYEILKENVKIELLEENK